MLQSDYGVFSRIIYRRSLGLLQATQGILLSLALLPMLAGVFIGGHLFSKSGGRNYRPLAIALVLGATAIGLIKLGVAQFL